MTGGKRCVGSAIVASIMTIMVAAIGIADQVIIKGMVTNDFQIVDAAGQSYDVAESDAADDMLARATGRKVEVSATLEESAGIRTITVLSFKVVDK
jgi:hypothetical protein